MKQIIVSLFLFNILLTAYCQTNKNAVIPSSPNVASLVSYAETPVGKYTGSPNISIPLYTVQSGSLRLPVSLSYNASGIRTNQEASWVGLGWSLNAGGVISHSIRGKDDFDNAFTAYWKHAYPTQTYNDHQWIRPIETTPTNLNYLQRTFSGELDPEPDLFSFSFAGYSGKFYMDKYASSGAGPVIRLIDQKDNLKISLVTNQNKFIITDGNGIKYYFGTAEYSNTDVEEHNWAENSYPPSEHDIEYVGTDCQDKRRISALYLDKIESPSGDEISFTYAIAEPCTGILSQAQLNAQNFKKINEILSENAFILPGNFTNYTYSKTLTEEVVLQYINFKNGYVSFISTSQRSDIVGHGLYTPKKLDAIGIATNDNHTKKEIHFNYSYFNNTNNPRFARLKLDALYTTELPYRFTYETSIALPSKLTNSIDHWGYYNGQANLSIIPSTSFEFAPIFDYGGNREVNPNFIQAGILKEIQYPTGGKTKFDFECNDFDNNTSEPIYEDGNIFLEASQHYYQGVQNPFEEIDFYLPPRSDGQLIPLKAGFYSSSQHLCEETLSGEPYALLVKIPGQNQANYTDLVDYIDNYSNYNINVIDIADYEGCNTPTYYEDHHTYYLQPGWYRIVLKAPEYYVASALINYHYVKGFNLNQYSRKGAGLRVQKISVLDQVNNTTITKYEYKNPENTRSSGKLMSTPAYLDASTVHLEDHYHDYSIGESDPMDLINTTTYVMVKSESYSPLSNAAQGSYVGYDRVTEIFGENGENGKKISTFSNSAAPSYIYSPPEDIITNGLLETEKVVNAAGDPLSFIENQYAIDIPSQKSTTAFSTTTMPFLYDMGLHPVTDFDPFPEMAASYFVNYYQLWSRWAQLTSSTTTLYSPTGNTVTTFNYNYNPDNKQVSKETKNIGNNTELITKYKYPTEYSSSAGSIYNAMVLAHVTNPPVEVQTWKNQNGTETLTGSSVIEYKEFNKPAPSTEKFISPFKTSRLIITSPLTTSQAGQTSSTAGPYNSLLFNSTYYDEEVELTYDLYGNTVSIKGKGGQLKSYLWGYDNSLPIAEIINASPIEIFYTGFEDNGTTGAAHTGTKYYNGDYSLSFTIPNGRSYKYSYWYRQSGVWTYSGLLSYTGAVTLTNGDAIDDVRVYPADAEMTTYTYELLLGINSATDANNRVTYYEYDGLARLRLIRDDKGNIIKKFCYNYQGQPEHCDVLTFFNVEMSNEFTPECGPNGLPAANVTYTVPENTYSSTISFADANQKALNDINLNGQTYANSYASSHNLCIPIYWNTEKSGTFTRNNCGQGGTGSTTTYTVPAHTYSSLISVDDADRLAQIDVNQHGQDYANFTGGTCSYIYVRLDSEFDTFYEDEYTYWENWNYYFRFFADYAGTIPLPLPSDLVIRSEVWEWGNGYSHYYFPIYADAGITEYIWNVTVHYTDPYYTHDTQIGLANDTHYRRIN